jgi:surface antigen
VYKDVGHVAIVEEVTDTTITILEANFYAGRVSRRAASAASVEEAAGLLGIAGYYRP